jgi:transcription termination/antitermination protein NusG
MGTGVAEHDPAGVSLPAGEPLSMFEAGGLGDWFVIHTKSRQEKILSGELERMGVVNYLPLIRQVRYYGRRKFKVEQPLFAGYLFLRGSTEQAYLADRTHRVAQIIKVSDQEHLTWELCNIQQALSYGAVLDSFPFLRKGVRVEVRSGPFRGLQGIIEDTTKNDRLILQVRTLGRAVCLEIEGALLDPLD